MKYIDEKIEDKQAIEQDKSKIKQIYIYIYWYFYMTEEK